LPDPSFARLVNCDIFRGFIVKIDRERAQKMLEQRCRSVGHELIVHMDAEGKWGAAVGAITS
jgi:hypothetical protein